MIGVTTPWVEGPAGMRLVAARQWRGTIFQQHKANLQLVLSRHSHVSFQHVTSRLAVSFISRARPFSRAGATPTNTGKRVWLARLLSRVVQTLRARRLVGQAKGEPRSLIVVRTAIVGTRLAYLLCSAN